MAYGIDFGTSSCSVAVWEPTPNGHGTRLVPLERLPLEWRGLDMESVLPTAFTAQGGGFALGWAAKLSKDGQVRVVKRKLHGDLEYQVGTVTLTGTTEAAIILGELKQRSAEHGDPFNRAVVTVPANATGAQRLRTIIAAKRAGIQVQGLVNEPTAAALAFLSRLPAGERDGNYLVFDWGGGTLDITVVEHDGGVTRQRHSAALKQVGGLEFDQKFRELLQDKGAQLGHSPWDESRVERSKIQLTTSESVTLVAGRTTCTVTRDEFSRSCSDLVQEAMDLVRQTVAAYPSTIDHLVAVGGTSRIPAVREALLATLHEEGLTHVEMLKVDEFNPLTAVAEGASIAAAMASGELKDEELHSAVANDLGVEALRTLGSKERVFSVIVPRDTPTPFSVTKRYRQLSPRDFSLTVLEGDARLEVNHPSQGVMTSRMIRVPSALNGFADYEDLGQVDPTSHAFEVEFSYDRDALLHIRVRSAFYGLLAEGPLLVADSLADSRSWRAAIRKVRARAEDESVFADDGRFADDEQY